MSVEIDPQELGFHRPFTVEVAETLRIKNPNTHPVTFKVKTTAPKQYCVRPNSGRIEPGRDVEVSVILQAMKQEPPMDAKCRDKFLVQSVSITGDQEFANLAAIWDSVEKSAIQEKKIRVVFLAPGGGSSAAVATPKRESLLNGHEATPDVAPPAYSSPSNYTTQPKKEDDVKVEDSPPAAAPVAVASTSTAQTNDTETEALKDQLAQAQKMIAKLKEDETGLRQRKAVPAEDLKAQSPAQQAQVARTGTEGVPVHITALLCLLCFLLAYLFF